MRQNRTENVGSLFGNQQVTITIFILCVTKVNKYVVNHSQMLQKSNLFLFYFDVDFSSLGALFCQKYFKHKNICMCTVR